MLPIALALCLHPLTPTPLLGSPTRPSQEQPTPDLLKDVETEPDPLNGTDRVGPHVASALGRIWFDQFLPESADERQVHTLSALGAKPVPLPLPDPGGSFGDRDGLRGTFELGGGRVLLWTEVYGGLDEYGGLGPIGNRLLNSDGTPEGTFALPEAELPYIDVVLPVPDTDPQRFVIVSTNLGGSTRNVHFTDGTQAGTRTLLDANGDTLNLGGGPRLESGYLLLGDRLIFPAYALGGAAPHSLELIDGATPVHLGLSGSLFVRFRPFRTGSTAVFAWVDPTFPLVPDELYTTDGTPEGTGLLLDVNPGPPNSIPEIADGDGSRVWFSATEAGFGRELWITDGTAGGTRRIVDLVPGPGNGTDLYSSSPNMLGEEFHGALLYRARPDEGSPALWISDGTEAGTRPVLDGVGAPVQDPLDWVDLGDRIAFTAVASGKGREPYVTDGVEALSLGDIAKGYLSSRPLSYADLGGATVFKAFTSETGGQLWKGAGPSSRAAVLTNASLPAAITLTLDSDPAGFVTVADRGFLVARAADPDGVDALQNVLVVTDGTSSGTREVLRTADELTPLAAFDRQLLFARELSSFGSELWISDGTQAGTRALAEGLGLATSVYERPWGWTSARQIGESVYFAGKSASSFNLWRTDGTPEGTEPLTDLPFGRELATPAFTEDYRLIHLGARVFFAVGSAGASVEEAELWISDGTPESTRPFAPELFRNRWLGDYVRAGDRIVMVLQRDSVDGWISELWSTDGTVVGTRMQALIGTGFRGYAAYLSSIGDDVLWPGSLDGNSGIVGLDPSHQPVELVPSGSSWNTYLSDSAPEASAKHFLVQGTDPALDGVWVSDGTPAGSRRISTALASSPNVRIRPFASGAGALLIERLENDLVRLWSSTGQPDGVQEIGTYPAKELDLGAGPIGPDLGRVGDRLVLAVDDALVGYEPHTLALTATGLFVAEPFGGPCAADHWPTLSLEGELRPGRDVALLLRDTAPAVPTLILASAEPTALDLLGCTLYLADPRLLALSTSDPDGLTRFPATVPNDPRLVGARAWLQAASPAAIPTPDRPLELSQGLELIVGP